jgi:hypothetical protein
MKGVFVCFALITLIATPGSAQEGTAAGEREETGLTVERLVFCTDVVDREPVGETTQFLHSIARIYCFSQIAGAADTTTVQHVWYFGDKEMARVDLPVRSSSWRTWSSKKMADGWADVWRVDVVSPDGTVLDSKEFLYKPMAR